MGDAAIVLGDGTIEGFVGGACAEQSVRLHALRALETGEALLLRILPGDDDAPAAEGAVTVQNPCLSGGSLEIFLEPMLASPRVLVVGDTPIAGAVARLGAELDLDVVTVPGADVEPAADDLALVVAAHGRDELHALRRGAGGRPALRGAGGQPRARRGGGRRAARRGRGGGAPGGTRDAGRARHRRAHPRGDRALDPRADRRRAPRRADGVGARGGARAGASRRRSTRCAAWPSRPSSQTPHVDHEGRRVYFCCDGCRTSFERDPPGISPHIDTVRWSWTRSQRSE